MGQASFIEDDDDDDDDDDNDDDDDDDYDDDDDDYDDDDDDDDDYDDDDYDDDGDDDDDDDDGDDDDDDDYYYDDDGSQLSDYTTNWINLEVGIAMGCTTSPVLFVMTLEFILKAAEGSAGPANRGGGFSIPPSKAFMDDTTIICSKEEETRRMLTSLHTLMAWCRIKFKPKKSRSLSIRKGKIEEAVTFTVSEQRIPTVSQEPMKSLGRYDSSMKDTIRGVETVHFTYEGLLAINKCRLQGKFEVWCLQLMLIPKLLWPLLFYDICCSTVEPIEAKTNIYTMKWLGVPP
ncbi:reverse transcriptase [Elysia marginata]|uniref:Reverse transcriptase n=1 Tax=Elysia marginata TaxID=1093978 RepID=A0AAV4H883_9GAST|nr:reverse transcriptase [Elysia marginata]